MYIADSSASFLHANEPMYVFCHFACAEFGCKHSQDDVDVQFTS